MKFYEFRKWFFDIARGSDDYIIFFLTRIKLGWNYLIYFQMHGSKRDPGQSFTPYIACIRSLRQKGNDDRVLLFYEGDIRFDNSNCSIKLEFEEFKVNLLYSSDNIFRPENSVYYDNRKNGFIEWKPLIPGGNVSGSINTRDGLKTFIDAKGYCDEVISTILPWKVPVSQLYWGRSNNDKINISYSLMRDRNSTHEISRLYLNAAGCYYILDSFTFKIIQYRKSTSMDLIFADSYIIHGTSGDLVITIEVIEHEEMILNDFMDYRHEYGKIATGLIRWISQNPHGIKFSAKANIDIRILNETYKLERAFFVDEYVEFKL